MFILKDGGYETEFDDIADAVDSMETAWPDAVLIHKETGLDETEGAAHFWLGRNGSDLSFVPDPFRKYLADEIQEWEISSMNGEHEMERIQYWKEML